MFPYLLICSWQLTKWSSLHLNTFLCQSLQKPCYCGKVRDKRCNVDNYKVPCRKTLNSVCVVFSDPNSSFQFLFSCSSAFVCSPAEWSCNLVRWNLLFSAFHERFFLYFFLNLLSVVSHALWRFSHAQFWPQSFTFLAVTWLSACWITCWYSSAGANLVRNIYEGVCIETIHSEWWM